MHELPFHRPTDSSSHIASLTTVTLEDGTTVTFTQIGPTVYVRDPELGIWDRAYMACVADGFLTYMRSPEVHTGTSSMKVHKSNVVSVEQSTLESATPILTPALAQAFRIEPPRPRFLVTDDGAVRAVELLWPQLGLSTHSVATDAPDGRWEDARPVPVHEAQPALHVKIVIGTEGPRGVVILECDDGVTRLDGRVVTDILECQRGRPLRLRYEDGDVQEFAAVVDARVQVSSPEKLDLPRRMTRTVAAIDAGVTSRYMERVAFLAERHMRGPIESRVTDERVECWLRDPEEVARRAGSEVTSVTEYVVHTIEDQERAEEALSAALFDGHDPFEGLSEEERDEIGVSP